MLRIFRNCRTLKNLCTRNVRKYSENKGPFYDCPHQQERIKEARRREEENKGPTHPFLVHTDHSKKALFYKQLFLFVCVPSLILGFINAFYIAEEPKRPPFVPYAYLRRRVRDYPWGDGKKSLFHNPRVNALSDGYEVDEEDD